MICEYGCGRQSNHVMSNGKHCCEIIHNKCPEVRRKNSKGLKKAHADGRLNTTHFDGKRNSRKGDYTYSKSEVFTKNSRFSSGYVKKRLLDEGLIEYICDKCKISEWNGSSISLELDHIDGDNRNNTRPNLRLLCPNCHSQTETWKGRNINTGAIKVTDVDLKESLVRNDNIRQALLDVGLAAKGANYSRCKKLLKEI